MVYVDHTNVWIQHLKKYDINYLAVNTQQYILTLVVYSMNRTKHYISIWLTKYKRIFATYCTIEIYYNNIWKYFWETNQNPFKIPDVIPLIAVVTWFIIRCIYWIWCDISRMHEKKMQKLMYPNVILPFAHSNFIGIYRYNVK